MPAPRSGSSARASILHPVLPPAPSAVRAYSSAFGKEREIHRATFLFTSAGIFLPTSPASILITLF